MLSHHEIKGLLPHRYPMLLVDGVTELHPGSHIIAVKNITGNEPCYERLADDAGARGQAYPCTLIIESFCQAAGVLYCRTRVEADGPVRGVMLFGSITRFRFYHEALPGDTLEHRVRLERRLSDAAIFTGEVWARGRKIAEVDRVVVAIRPVTILTSTAPAVA